MSQTSPTDYEITEYARQYVLYGDQTKAFYATFPDSEAKPNSVHAKASGFHKLDKVQLRIQELHESINGDADSMALFGIKQAFQELEEARQNARKNDRPSAMVSATMGKVKIAGLLNITDQPKSSDGFDLMEMLRELDSQAQAEPPCLSQTPS